MTKAFILFLAVGGISIAASCSEDAQFEAGPATTTGPGSTTAPSSSTGQQGPGGSGSGAQGGSPQGGQGQGGNNVGGNGACASCNDWLMDPATVAITDICGVLSYNPSTGEVTCTAGTSCELLAPLLTCACTDCPDGDECGPDLCMAMTASQQCTTCLARVCDPQNACAND